MIPNIMIQWDTRENKKMAFGYAMFFVDRKYRRRHGVENRGGGGLSARPAGLGSGIASVGSVDGPSRNNLTINNQ